MNQHTKRGSSRNLDPHSTIALCIVTGCVVVDVTAASQFTPNMQMNLLHHPAFPGSTIYHMWWAITTHITHIALCYAVGYACVRFWRHRIAYINQTQYALPKTYKAWRTESKSIPKWNQPCWLPSLAIYNGSSLGKCYSRKHKPQMAQLQRAYGH